MLLAMLVLVGFGALSLMAVDDHPDQKREPISIRIAKLRGETLQLRKSLKEEEAVLDGLRRKAGALDQIRSKGLSLRGRVEAERKELDSAKSGLATLDAEFGQYRKSTASRCEEKPRE